MNTLDKIKYVGESCMLRDSMIGKIQFDFFKEPSISISIKTTEGKDIRIDFSGVINFNFSEDISHLNGILISHYKLFKLQDGSYYFSFDPYSENNEPEYEDNCLVIFKDFVFS
jgi:hypothetical protein